MPLPSLPLVIGPFSSVLVFPRQDTGLLQPKPLVGITRAVAQLLSGCCVENPWVPNTQSRVIWKDWELLCVPGKSMPSSRPGQQAPSLEVILHGGQKHWEVLSPPSRLVLSQGCAIAKSLSGNKPSTTAVNQPGFRLLRQHLVWGSMRRFDVCCGSWWVGAPRGLPGAALSFSISHLASPEPPWHHTCWVSLDQAWSPKRRGWKVAAQLVCLMFWSTHHQWPGVHWPLVEKQYFGPFGPFFR